MLFIFLLIISIKAQCPVYTPTPLEILWIPTLNNTLLINNYLQLEIDIPIVSNRSNYSLIISNCPNCSYYNTSSQWNLLEKNCQLSFLSNISLDNFVPLLNNVNLINITISYQELVSYQNMLVIRNIVNILSFLIYFNNVITLSTQLININSYSNLEHTSVNNTFNQGEIVYINFYDNISFSILEISIGDKYLLLNNELTSIGLYNQLKINGNEFQFQVNIGNSSDDLVNNTGYYEIFIVLESNSRAKKTYISSLYLLFSNIAQKSSPPPTKKSPSPSFNMQLFGLFSLGVVIPIILYFIYSKNKKRIEINPV